MVGYAVGVDLGGTNLRVAVVDEKGRMLEKLNTPTVELRTSERVIDRMCEHIKYLIDKHSGNGPLHGIGIAIPGIIDLDTGVLRECPNLPGWYDYPARDEIERRLGTKVILENDANAAAMGEFWLGAAREYDSTCMLTLGTGIGGGIIIKGALWHGMTGMAGEPGHSTVDPDGPLCGCGNRGCLEQFAGATAIVRMAKEAVAGGGAPGIENAMVSETPFTARSVYELAMKGDGPAQKIFERSGRALGITIASMINTLNLPIYIIGGGGSGGWDAFSPYIFEEVEQRSFVYRATMQHAGSKPRPRTRITRAMLGSDAGIFGAARLPMLPEEVYEHSLHQGAPAAMRIAEKESSQ
jgi:glucokinase